MPKKNAISMLKEDHQKVRDMLDKLEKTTERGVKRRQEILTQLEHEIKLHMQIEEELFYPAMDEAAGKKEDHKLIAAAREEHHAARGVLRDLVGADPATIDFAGKAKVFKDLIEHHIQEEEKVMFPHAKQLFEMDELEQLGHKIEERKVALKGEREPERLQKQAS